MRYSSIEIKRGSVKEPQFGLGCEGQGRREMKLGGRRVVGVVVGGMEKELGGAHGPLSN